MDESKTWWPGTDRKQRRPTGDEFVRRTCGSVGRQTTTSDDCSDVW